MREDAVVGLRLLLSLQVALINAPLQKLESLPLCQRVDVLDKWVARLQCFQSVNLFVGKTLLDEVSNCDFRAGSERGSRQSCSSIPYDTDTTPST